MMREFREVVQHLSMLPYRDQDIDNYLKLLDSKISAFKQQQDISSPRLEARLEKLLTLIQNLKHLPQELIHLLYNLEVLQRDLDTGKMKAIVEKIERVLYTYVAEDPKKYLKHSLVLREIYRTITEIAELLVINKLEGAGKVES